MSDSDRSSNSIFEKEVVYNKKLGQKEINSDEHKMSPEEELKSTIEGWKEVC